MQECPFNNNKCAVLIDYQVAQIALQEAAGLCFSNWSEFKAWLVQTKWNEYCELYYQS